MKHSNWLVHFLEKGFKNRFFYARLTRIPWIAKLVYHIAFENDQIIYLPKSSVIPVNQKLSAPQSTICPSQVIEHFIDNARYHFIMNFCICREAEGCRDYPIELGCLFMGDAVLDIDRNLGRLVTREQAYRHVRQCSEAGLVHLIGRNKLDTLWLRTGPGSRLLTVCNCCPCCCLWKMLPDLNPLISNRIAKMPGIKVRITDRCNGCGICTRNICFVNAISMNEEHAVISSQCRGCGRCVEVCPNHAIEIEIPGDGYIEKIIASISAVVDVM